MDYCMLYPVSGKSSKSTRNRFDEGFKARMEEMVNLPLSGKFESVKVFQWDPWVAEWMYKHYEATKRFDGEPGVFPLHRRSVIYTLYWIDPDRYTKWLVETGHIFDKEWQPFYGNDDLCIGISKVVDETWVLNNIENLKKLISINPHIIPRSMRTTEWFYRLLEEYNLDIFNTLNDCDLTKDIIMAHWTKGSGYKHTDGEHFGAKCYGWTKGDIEMALKWPKSSICRDIMNKLPELVDWELFKRMCSIDINLISLIPDEWKTAEKMSELMRINVKGIISVSSHRFDNRVLQECKVAAIEAWERDHLELDGIRGE